MINLEEKVDLIIKDIDSLHYIVERAKWADLKRDGFVFELEKSYEKLNEIYKKMFELNKELYSLLEKNTPQLNDFLEQLKKQLIVLEANIKMEKSKRIRIELINEMEEINMPELYSSIQTKVAEQLLKCRYNIEKVKTFLINRKTPFIKKGSTAKNLIEILEQREDEISDLKRKNLDLKRKSFTRSDEEKDIIEIETGLQEKNKKLEISVRETKNALKTHLAQINYVEGSFVQLQNKISEIEDFHSSFIKDTLDLVKELKKERDHARKFAIDVESETLQLRNNYTKELLNIEDKKSELKEKLNKKYSEEIKNLKKELNEKSISLANIVKLVEEQEKEIKELRKLNLLNQNSKKSIYQ